MLNKFFNDFYAENLKLTEMPNSIVRCIICKSKAKLFEKIRCYEKTINKDFIFLLVFKS